MSRRLTCSLMAFVLILSGYSLSMNSDQNNSGKEKSLIGRVSRKTNTDGDIIYSKNFNDGNRWICKKFKNNYVICFCVIGNLGKSSKLLPVAAFEQLESEYKYEQENQKIVNKY